MAQAGENIELLNDQTYEMQDDVLVIADDSGAIGMAGRERLGNLVFVINCNLQRLDGPVRGNGSIIQELESEFRGSGWIVS